VVEAAMVWVCLLLGCACESPLLSTHLFSHKA
jgi:hypothetical protein